MIFEYWSIAVAVIIIGNGGMCQLSDNTPPVMVLDRSWVVRDDEANGSVVTIVKAHDNEQDRLEFGLETAPTSPSGDYNPFRIDRKRGVVYLNQSLKGKAGKNLFLFVTVTDGRLTTKAEVYVNIVNASADGYGGGNSRSKPPHPPPVNPFYVSQLLPGGRPVQFRPTIGKPPTKLGDTIQVLPGPGNEAGIQERKDILAHSSTAPPHSNIGRPPEGKNQTEDEGGGGKNVPADTGMSSLGGTVVPVVVGCALLLLVAGASAVFFHRKFRCRDPAQKDKDLRKDASLPGALSVGFRSSASSSATTSVPLSSTDSSNGPSMQHWRSARALSNRYESWDTENGPMGGIANGRPAGGDAQGNDNRQPMRDPWEFPRHRLRVFNILGEGCFGQVWRCEAQDINGVEGPTIVAVKTLKENSGEKERQDLLQELHVMKMLDPHPNVVRLIGCCTDKDPIFVIMEYMSGGKLQSYLRSTRAERSYGNLHGKSENLSSRDLTSFVYQVARGMQYLSSRGIIHRDLAARNVLISANRICKVADFGFARDIAANHVYERKSEGRLPIRWMAPESLYDNIFTTKSDVWSFGVFAWEVVTLGSTPYPGLAASDVMKKVRDGLRLEKPEHCRRELFNVMYYCWDKDPKERPTFGELVTLLEGLLLTETDYIELERFPDHCYYNVVSLSGEKV
ncbi:tyrosine kinase receptor Cad96Ca [Ischnura elegans]|uniref:tyrosine kinase receptor Cad96Ca n=1 Tax=Ischnura elegans TaxID=197161 RepID=UPI001ED87260|nr:tyrosine kinase receptor Cad96Ca [Ischnura elegans]